MGNPASALLSLMRFVAHQTDPAQIAGRLDSQPVSSTFDNYGRTFVTEGSPNFHFGPTLRHVWAKIVFRSSAQSPLLILGIQELRFD